MDEFALIGKVVETLGPWAEGEWVVLGPGDDAAVIALSPQHESVASIDTLVADVHFPASAPAEYVGYRAMMVALSDLAAMAATPKFVLVAVSMPADDADWALALAAGIRRAAEVTHVYVCGGNFSRGPLSITVSVHGEVPVGAALTRSGAQIGDDIYVSGDLGGAAACVREQAWRLGVELTKPQIRYFEPCARFDLQPQLRAHASAGIDISDGLLADLQHLCRASDLAADLNGLEIPVCEGASLEDALHGGDDYQILATSAQKLEGMQCIGKLYAGDRLLLDGQPVETKGYNHFGA